MENQKGKTKEKREDNADEVRSVKIFFGNVEVWFLFGISSVPDFISKIIFSQSRDVFFSSGNGLHM